MTLHVFLLLLLFVLMFSLARLCSLCWPHHGPAQSAAATRRTPLQRLLKPRSPHDCPACRLSCAHSSVVEPVPPTVRPWREVKSRRGAPKRVNTEGFACPNRECPYSGITDLHIHALVGDGKHGHAERIQTFRGSVCHTTFTARRHTPLVSSENPFSPDRCGKDFSRAHSRPPHAKHGPYAHPLPATDPSRLSASRSSPVMASICTSTHFPAHFGQWLEVARRGRKARQW